MRQQRGRGRGEDVAARLLHQPFDERIGPRDEGARHARGFAQRGHVEHARRGVGADEARLGQRAAPLGAEHAEAVGVVDQQQRVVPLAQRVQCAHIGHVSVHAEHGISDHELAPRGAGREQGVERGEVRMRVAVHRGARQARAVDQAGVVERVGEQRVACAHERGHDADVGRVARIEVERARQLHEAREVVLQRGIRQAVAADQG